MNERNRLGLILAVCGVLLLIGFVFSVRVTSGIAGAAHQEAVNQSPVPTPPALQPAKAKANAAANG